jgi:hypothetical protein
MQEHIDKVKALDVADASTWKDVMETALQVIPAETLCEELSCSTGTLERWKFGRVAPGPSAREGIRGRILELMSASASVAT